MCHKISDFICDGISLYPVHSCFYLQSSGLHFRHTDNTVQWLRAMESVGLPKVGGFHRHGDARPVQIRSAPAHWTHDSSGKGRLKHSVHKLIIVYLNGEAGESTDEQIILMTNNLESKSKTPQVISNLMTASHHECSHVIIDLKKCAAFKNFVLKLLSSQNLYWF